MTDAEYGYEGLKLVASLALLCLSALAFWDAWWTNRHLDKLNRQLSKPTPKA